MASVVAGHRKVAKGGNAVVARVVTSRVEQGRTRDEALVEVHVADRRLAAAIARGVVASLEAAIQRAPEAGAERVVRFRTERRLAAIEAIGFDGALAILRVTPANVRRIGAYVERACRAGASGVQIVWDGETPPRDRAERWVFDALERARGAPKGSPVVLAPTSEPLEILRMSARARLASRREEPR